MQMHLCIKASYNFARTVSYSIYDRIYIDRRNPSSLYFPINYQLRKRTAVSCDTGYMYRMQRCR